ncbi:MAG: hypothetical protein KAJ76_08355, partial [Candidatus Heimdallarchaeota archaeon]|nr:hypothetical protein [Candidatus Heimdallarchaeota archaeon]
MPQNILSLRRFSLKRALTIVFVSSFLLLPVIFQNSPTNFGRAHSAIASPKEIFSLWNDTSPLIDGAIGFSPVDMDTEWSSAAVYNMFDEAQLPNSKLLLQNDNTNLYIGLDITDHLVADPDSFWGCSIYLDRDHNGILSIEDRAIFFYDDNFGLQYVTYNQYQDLPDPWLELESGTPGIALPTYNILIDHDFTSSYFESINHRQYEIRIPLSILDITPGNITGFAVASFEDLTSDDRILWPEFN